MHKFKCMQDTHVYVHTYAHVHLHTHARAHTDINTPLTDTRIFAHTCR